MATEFDAYERRMWAGRAADYERVFMQQSRRMAEPLLDAVDAGPGVRLLDVGTGPGPVAAAAVARGAEVTAVDADPGMVALAARNVPDARVREAILPDLDLPYGEYDAVVGNFVINHVGEPYVVVAALRRHLRDGGRLGLTCWHQQHTVSSVLVRHALEKARLTVDDLDLIEINEAFAQVAIQSMRELKVDESKVNVNGGAIALGHPIGMSGARLVLTLALELKRRGGGTGAASLCGGGGQGDALIIKVAA
jgi:SAM-dependent methyltransferase